MCCARYRTCWSPHFLRPSLFPSSTILFPTRSKLSINAYMCFYFLPCRPLLFVRTEIHHRSVATSPTTEPGNYFIKYFWKKKTQAVLQKGRIIQEIAYTVRWGPTVAYRRSALWLASSSVCWVVRRGLMDNSHSTIIRSTVASSNSPMR